MSAERLLAPDSQQSHHPPPARHTPPAPQAAPPAPPARAVVSQGGRANGPAQVAAIQRMQQAVGNRAMQRLRPGPTTRLPVAIQRVNDLRVVYDYANRDNEQKAWIDDFSEIQRLLTDKTRVDRYLRQLALSVVKSGLTKTLAASESGSGWTKARPVLLGFVPAASFVRMVGQGQLFEDLVGQTHGVEAHRIQWYIIRSAISAGDGNWQHSAAALFRQAVHPVWAKDSRQMWDHIVDELGDDQFDFTTPDRLTAYIKDSDTKELKKLVQSFTRRETGRTGRKNTLLKNAPRWKLNNRQAPDDAPRPDDMITRKGIRYTGWAVGNGEWDKWWIPTIMYPKGMNPNESTAD